MQPGGESKGRMYLRSFLDDRVKNYNLHISKPDLARKGCSRLSPYLAWGCLSIREVYQLSEEKSRTGFQVRNFTNFQSRLRWHCHFIQKFEMESRMEFEPINRGFFSSLAIKNAKMDTGLGKWSDWLPLGGCMHAMPSGDWLSKLPNACDGGFISYLSSFTGLASW